MVRSEMMAIMPASEFVEWMAYYSMEPFGEIRSDLRAGIIASTVANVNRGEGVDPFKASDFMPKFEDRTEAQPQDPQSMKQLLTMLKAAQDARLAKGKNARVRHP